MPNDSNSQFPLPSEAYGEGQALPAQTANAVGGDPSLQSDPNQERPLTDTVAPDLSAPPIIERPTPTPVIEPTPIYTPPTIVNPPTPATLPPSSSKPFPVVTILLLLISTGAIAATYFFFQQSQNLNTQLTEITKTLEQQTIKENQVTPTPSVANPPLAEMPTPSATISAAPTPTITTSSNSIFRSINSVLSSAQARYPESQLLMITALNSEDPSRIVVKYWFRQTLTSKKYLYVLKDVGKDLSVVDQQVYVTPDDNIPSLNQMATSGKLGLDLDEAIKIAISVCPANFDCVNTSLNAQFIKANTTLWQLSFKPSGTAKPFVVQIDSVTSKILFKSL